MLNPSKVTPMDAEAVVVALANLTTPTPTVEGLAGAMGCSAADLAEVLDRMERRGRIERWPDGGDVRVMLSAREARWMGLMLGRRPTRWVPAAMECAR